MASPTSLSVERGEGTAPLWGPLAERAPARAAGLDAALPQRADGPGFHAGAPPRHRTSGSRRDPRDARYAGTALRART